MTRVRGATLVEYLILLGAVALVSLGIVSAFGKEIAGKLRGEGDAVSQIGEGGAGNAAAPALPGVGSASEPPPSTSEPQGWGSWLGDKAASAGNGALSLGKGFFVDGAWGTVKGTWDLGVGLVTEPRQTLGSLKDGVVGVVTDPVGTARDVGANLKKQWNEDPMRLVGAGIFQVIPASKVGALGKLGGATKAAEAVATEARAAQALTKTESAVVGAAARRAAKVEVIGLEQSSGPRPRIQLDADTPVYRVQDPKLALTPHESPYFDPVSYGLGFKEHEALYVSTSREAIEELRRSQGYFEQGATLHTSTIGELVEKAGPGAKVFVDERLPDHSLVIVRPTPPPP